MTLHAKQLNISGGKWTTVSSTGGHEPTESELEQVLYNFKETTATLTFEEPLPLGDVEVHIDFTGILNTDMNGFYRSLYTNIDGMKLLYFSGKPRPYTCHTYHHNNEF